MSRYHGVSVFTTDPKNGVGGTKELKGHLSLAVVEPQVSLGKTLPFMLHKAAFESADNLTLT